MSKSRFIVSKSKVLEQYKKLKDLGYDVSYSLKTFPEIASILEENTDSSFSIHMPQSLEFIKDMKRVWFIAQALNKENLDFLFKKRINRFVVDNETDMNTLINYIEKEDVEIDLFLRMKIKEHTIHTGRYFVFGMSSSKINSLIPKLRSNKKIRNLGIHFHRKTQNTSEWDLKRELIESLNEEVLRAIDLLNVGGGLPVEYKNTTDRNLGYIFQKLVELREWANDYDIKTIVEPGRFISGPPTKLETEIILIDEKNIIVDCSVYNGATDTIIVPIKLLVGGELESGESYVIKGCTPCSMDIFRYDVKLKNPKVGDKVVFVNAGAYNFRTDFCNLSKLEVVIVD